jgi:hypothetical protein
MRDTERLVIYGIAIFLLITAFNQCNKKKAFQDEIESYVDYTDTVKYYKAKNGDIVSYNESLEISENTLKIINDSLGKALNNIKIKDPEVIIQIEERVVIKEVEVTFIDSIPCPPFNKPFDLSHKFYSLSGSFTNTKLKLDSIKIPNTRSVVVGTKRNGFLKRNDHIVTIQNSNPFMNSKKITSYTIKEEKKWYETTSFKMGLGFVGGVFIYRTMSK